MFTQPKSKPARLLASTVARLLVILSISLVGLMAVRPQAAQADTSICGPEYFCASYEQDLPGAYEPQLTVLKPTHAYTGPGYNYLNYGDLPLGYTSRVTGISEDGRWLVIPLPVDIASSGQAWVYTADVSTQNIQVVPDWLLHCDPMTYCGYILSQTQPSTLAAPDWLAHCDPMTYCGYILANSPEQIRVVKVSEFAQRFGMTTR